MLSAFATDTALVLAHIDIAEKSNEIPAAQALLAELGLAPGAIVTLDALHCQKTSRHRRTVTIFDPANTLADTDWHPHVAAVIRVERSVYTRNAKTGLLRHAAETAFYVSNTPMTATRAAEAVRAHGRIENTAHHSRDVTLGEDRSRIRTNPGVFARLRSFAFNILKANRTDTLSQDRYRAGLAGIGKPLRTLAVS